MWCEQSVEKNHAAEKKRKVAIARQENHQGRQDGRLQRNTNDRYVQISDLSPVSFIGTLLQICWGSHRWWLWLRKIRAPVIYAESYVNDNGVLYLLSYYTAITWLVNDQVKFYYLDRPNLLLFCLSNKQRR